MRHEGSRTVGGLRTWVLVLTVGGWAVLGERALADAIDIPGAPTAEEVVLAGQSRQDDLPICVGGCGFGRDACGWPTDPCGGRLGRIDLTLEGTWSLPTDIHEPLGLDSGAPNQVFWRSLDFEGVFGGRGALGLRTSPLDRIRLKGGWYGEWDDDAQETGVYGFSPPPTTSPDSAVLLSSEASLWGVSLQWVRELACCGRYRFDGILGARAMSFDETSTASIQSLAVAAAGPSGVVRSEAENWFYGGEIGAAFDVRIAPRWTLSVGGVFFLGLASKDVTIQDSGLFTAGAKTASATDDVFAFGTDLEASLTWHFAPRVGLTFGYQFQYLSEITRGPSGMDFSRVDTGQVQAQTPAGQVTLHTFFAGLAFNF